MKDIRKMTNHIPEPNAHHTQKVYRPHPFRALTFGIIFSILSLSFGVPLLSEWVQDKNIIHNGEVVQGAVKEVDKDRRPARQGRKPMVTEHIVVTYDTPKGSYTISEEKTTDRADFIPTELNSAITVYYDAENPSNGVVKGWESSLWVPIVIGGVFFICAAFQMTIFVLGLRALKRLRNTEINGVAMNP
ncbi:MAG: DUF3592 domain-containing protein [Enterococcus sp.]|nr:DUF3592 domain-containing protein [Enterococcus sp.]